jgi:hypothetical protein
MFTRLLRLVAGLTFSRRFLPVSLVGGPGRIRTCDTRVKSSLHGILLTCRLGRKGPSTCGFAYSPLLVVSHHFSSSCGLSAAWMFRQRPRAFTSDGSGPLTGSGHSHTPLGRAPTPRCGSQESSSASCRTRSSGGSLLRGVELQRAGVHAVAFAGGLGAVVEHVAQMPAAARAGDLGPPHQPRAVLFELDRARPDRPPKARPPGHDLTTLSCGPGMLGEASGELSRTRRDGCQGLTARAGMTGSMKAREEF